MATAKEAFVCVTADGVEHYVSAGQVVTDDEIIKGREAFFNTEPAAPAQRTPRA